MVYHALLFCGHRITCLEVPIMRNVSYEVNPVDSVVEYHV